MRCRIGYTDRDSGSAATKDLVLMAHKGWYDFDAIRRFPGLAFDLVSGGIEEIENVGVNREITLDFGVVAEVADRRALAYFAMDSARTINLVIAAPAGTPSLSAVSGGTLSGDQFYTITAIDDVGETTGATEVSLTFSAPNQTASLSWSSVTGALGYRLYRTTSTGVYAGTHFLKQVTGTSTTDDGSVALTSTYQLPTVQLLSVALRDPSRFSNTWLNNHVYGRKYVFELIDKTLRTKLIP